MAQGLEKGGAGVGGIGAEMAVGMSDGAADDEPAGRHHGPGDAGGGRGARGIRDSGNASVPPMRPPSSACPKSDVIASLEAGDLKGKRIGTQWRITKGAIADFLK